MEIQDEEGLTDLMLLCGILHDKSNKQALLTASSLGYIPSDNVVQEVATVCLFPEQVHQLHQDYPAEETQLPHEQQEGHSSSEGKKTDGNLDEEIPCVGEELFPLVEDDITARGFEGEAVFLLASKVRL